MYLVLIWLKLDGLKLQLKMEQVDTYGILKSEHETRLRFEDYLETAMIEAVPAEAATQVLQQFLQGLNTGAVANLNGF